MGAEVFEAVLFTVAGVEFSGIAVFVMTLTALSVIMGGAFLLGALFSKSPPLGRVIAGGFGLVQLTIAAPLVYMIARDLAWAF